MGMHSNGLVWGSLSTLLDQAPGTIHYGTSLFLLKLVQGVGHDEGHTPAALQVSQSTGIEFPHVLS